MKKRAHRGDLLKKKKVAIGGVTRFMVLKMTAREASNGERGSISLIGERGTAKDFTRLSRRPQPGTIHRAERKNVQKGVRGFTPSNRKPDFRDLSRYRNAFS